MTKSQSAWAQVAVLFGTASVLCGATMLAYTFLNTGMTVFVAVVFGAASLGSAFTLCEHFEGQR